MDCLEVKELLDAYALGATEKGEAVALERHLADCVRCWEELNEVQRTTALLSLAVPLEEAPASLRDRVLARAEQEEGRQRLQLSLRHAVRRGWPAAVGAVAVAGAGALALAAFLQVQVSDLRGEKGQLERQVQEVGEQLGEQQAFMTLLASPDVQEVSLASPQRGSGVVATYYWSQDTQSGFLVCNKLPPLAEGQSYQAWILSDGEAVSAGTFQPSKGIGHVPVDLSEIDWPPSAIGVTIEDADGSAWPTDGMFLYASLSR